MIKVNKVEVLADAIKQLAHTHHYTRLHSEHPDLHYGQYFQHCPASSCTAAFNALYNTGIFKPKELATRKRVQEKMYDRVQVKIEQGQRLPKFWKCDNCEHLNQIDSEFDNTKCIWCQHVRTVDDS